MFQIDSATPLSFTNIKFSSKYPTVSYIPAHFSVDYSVSIQHSTSFICRSTDSLKSVPLGIYYLMWPLAFSLAHLSQE